MYRECYFRFNCVVRFVYVRPGPCPCLLTYYVHVDLDMGGSMPYIDI